MKKITKRKAVDSNIGAICAVMWQEIAAKSIRTYDDSKHLGAGIQWLLSAQDATEDGGVSKGFVLHKGWLPSYVETTGYIIPTMFDCAVHTGREEISERASNMAQWELTKQLANGAFPGCSMATPGGPLVFDTGMVIFGLARAYRETGVERFLDAAQKAGDWLIDNQTEEGGWVRHTLYNKPRAYHARVAWALLELWQITDEKKYYRGARKQLDWVIKHQRLNGWFEKNTFYDESENALTHTIAYTARGLLESGVILKEDRYVFAARKCADTILKNQRLNGSIPGRFGPKWESDHTFSCMSANSQVALIWLRLREIEKTKEYDEGIDRVIDFLKKKQNLCTGNNGVYGGIKASDPIYRGYLKFFYSNWATKFFVDLLLGRMSLKTF